MVILRPSWRPRHTPDVVVPADLDQLAGPRSGIFDPPVQLYWQPGALDFSDPVVRRVFYASALTKAAHGSQLIRWVDAESLRDQWPRIALPSRVRAAWETLHPQLRGEDVRVNARLLVQDTILSAIADLGFALAGGSALIDYDVVSRDTEDIDAFLDRLDAAAFTAAAAAVIDACRSHGWGAELVHDQDLDKQVRITVADDTSIVVQMVYHQRSTEPEHRDGGGLRLVFDDVVGGKAVAAADSARGRDFSDLAHIVSTAGWSLARVEEAMVGLRYADMVPAFRESIRRFRRGEFDDDIAAVGLDVEFCHKVLDDAG